MYITKIKLKNFRCYENEEFSMQEGAGLSKPITIIYGLEGSGKTTVFNAVGWALYGEETEALLNEQKQDLAIPNVNAFSSSSRAEVSVSVDLMFEKDKEISRVRITNTAEFIKGMSDASYLEREANIFYINGRTQSIADKTDRVEFKNFIEKYFPPQLLKFYMFTGEYLKQTYTTKGSNLEGGIMGQFKTGAIKHMAKELEDIRDQYAKIARKKSNNQTLENELNIEKEKEGKLVVKLDELNGTISKLEEHIKNEDANITRYHEDYGRLKQKSERIKERDELSDTLKKKNGEIAELETSLYNDILEKAHFLHSEEKLAKVIKIIGDKVGRRKLPPDVEAPFVKSLLEGHLCICGREISHESEEETHLLHILKEKEPEQGMEILTYLQSPIRMIKEDISNWRKGIADNKLILDRAIIEASRISAALSSISDLEKDLNDEEKKIKGEYESATRRKTELSDDLGIEKAKKLRIENEQSENAIRIMNINNKIFKESEKTIEVEDANKNYQTAGLVREALLKIPEDLFKEYAERLQNSLNDVLYSFDIISQFAAKVSYSEKGLSFAFKELSPEFEGFGTYMSGGQNQLVGICMMASFISVLGEIGRNVVEPPMVFMDHPISNLSERGKSLFQKKLMEIFKGIQLMVIATDGEIAGFLEHCGREKISKLYMVENDRRSKSSHKKEME